MNIFVITGPSGSGKSHLIHELVPLGICPLEVYTDRGKRPSETKKTDRRYLTIEEFNSNLNKFLYWFEFQGNRYGYKKSDIARQKRLGNPICFNIPPMFLPNILERLPEAIVIYLNVDEQYFPMLYERMLNRDLSKSDNKRQKKFKRKKIEDRLDYARQELEELESLQFLVSNNPASKVFSISNDTTLYQEVIPHIKKLI